MDLRENEKDKTEYLKRNITHPKIPSTHINLLNIYKDYKENGISCLDIMNYIENSGLWENKQIITYMMEFYRIKSEYRCEKMLMFYMLELIYLR